MSIVQRENEEIEIDIWEVVKLMFSKAPVILVCTLLCGLVAYAGIYFFVPPQYQAGITMYVNNRSQAENSTTMSQSDLNASAQLVDTYSAIITSRSVLREVIEEAEVEMTVEALQEAISTEAVNNTEVFEVTVLDPDPKVAARIANAVANIAPDQISQIVEGSSVKVVDYADIPDEIAKPSYVKLAAIGMVLGFVASAAVIFIREMLDTSVKSEADFSRWSYPILSTIPDLEEARKGRKGGYGYGYGGYGRRAV